MRFKASFLDGPLIPMGDGVFTRRAPKPLPDPLADILAAGGIEVTSGRIGLLRANLDAIKNQHKEHRPRPGRRQISREMEAWITLSAIYATLGGSGAIPGAGGPFYRFCAACAHEIGISKIQEAEQFRKSFSSAIQRAKVKPQIEK